MNILQEMEQSVQVDLDSLDEQIKDEELTKQKEGEEDGLQKETEEKEQEQEEEIEELEVEEDSIEEEEPPKTGKAYQKLRKQKQEAEAEKQRLAVENQAIKERLAKFEGQLEALTGTKNDENMEPEDREPEFDEYNQKEWLDWKSRQDSKKIEALQNKIAEAEQQQSIAQSRTLWDGIDRDFGAKDEIYKNSMEYLRSQAKEQLQQMNPGLSDYAINSKLKELEYQHVGQASAAGIAPDIYFKSLAMQEGFDHSSVKSTQKQTITKSKQNQRKSASVIGQGSSGGSDEDVAGGGFRDMTLEQLEATQKEWFR